jgi:hypothetical protein
VQALLEKPAWSWAAALSWSSARGASRALCFALASRGAKKLYILDPLEQASGSLAQDLNRRVRQCAQAVPFAGAPVGDLLGQSDVLVNASGVGMFPHTDETPVDKRHLRKGLLVCDLTSPPGPACCGGSRPVQDHERRAWRSIKAPRASPCLPAGRSQPRS